MSEFHPIVAQSRALCADQKHTAAFQLIEESLQPDPESKDLCVEKARLLMYRQREAEALDWLEKGWGAPGSDEVAAILAAFVSSREWRRIGSNVPWPDYSPLQSRLNALAGNLSPNPTAKISAVLIVKNEEAHLRKCLGSLMGKVDEIVVVDTGSTDATVAIAEEFGARIGHFDWCDDFSAARNAALDLASGDWALWIDADECVDCESWGAIYEGAIRPHFGGYFVRIVNFTDEHENSTYTHAPIRLFQLRPEIRFEGRIHEQVSPSIDALALPTAHLNGATIWHYGYKPSEMESKNKLERTISLLKTQIEEEPNEAFHWFNLANTYSVNQRHDDVISAAKNCLRLMDPGNSFGTIAYQLLASSLVATNKLDEALKVGMEAKAKGHFTVLNEFELAHTLYRLGRFEEALAAIDACMAADWPEDMTGDRGIKTHKSNVLKGQILCELGRYHKAIEQLEYALSVDPNFALAQLALGITLERVGKLEDAYAWVSKGLEDPNFGVYCLRAAGRIKKTLGDCAKAASLLERAWTFSQDDPESWALWAQAAELSEDVPTMLRAYQEYEQRFQPCASVWINWGRALEANGDLVDAETKFRRAAELDPADANTYLNMADYWYRQGQFMRAAEAYELALKLDAENAEAWFMLGNAFGQLGVIAGAGTAYRQALRLNPNHGKALHNLSLVEGQVA